MKKFLSVILSILVCSGTLARQTDSVLTKQEFRSEISRFDSRIKALERNNNNLSQKYLLQQEQTDSIARLLLVARSNIQQIADSLHITMANVSTADKQTQDKIQSINQDINHRTYYWAIAILLVVSLGVAAFFVLRKNLSSSTHNLDLQIEKTNQAMQIMQHESVKLDAKLAEVLQTQLAVLNEERKNKAGPVNEANHKLPLKVGDEIHRMRKRMDNMPKDTKGLSALANSLQRLEDEFNASGYDIEELLGKKYVDGMKVEARFVDNPDIPKGEEIITDVLRPQIMFKGMVIQAAKVEVGKSY